MATRLFRSDILSVIALCGKSHLLNSIDRYFILLLVRALGRHERWEFGILVRVLEDLFSVCEAELAIRLLSLDLAHDRGVLRITASSITLVVTVSLSLFRLFAACGLL